MENWEQNLRNQLKSVKKEPWEESLLKEIGDPQPKKSSNFFTYFFIILAIVFAGIIGKSIIFRFKTKPIPTQKITVEELNKKLDGLKSKIVSDSRRIDLIGVVINENFFVLKNNKDKKDLIFFNRDWKLRQMPKHLSITPEDREYLKKYLED